MVLGNWLRSSYSKHTLAGRKGRILAKAYRKIQKWDQWLEQFPGRGVLAAESQFLHHLLSQFYGNQTLLIGTPHQYTLLKSSIMPNQLLLGPLLTHNSVKHHRSIESELHDLPIASGSLDLVLVPHILEYLDNPQQLLSEACRIVKPEGHIIVCGFNPYSLWGIKKWFSRDTDIPWTGSFIQPSTIKKWLQLADFKLVTQSMVLFRPPVQKETTFKKLKFLEWLGRKCFRPFGGVYILVAQAKVVPLTPIKLRWKQQLSGMRLPTIGVPRPTLRNSRR